MQRLIAISVVLAILMLGFWLQQGGWMDINPKYAQRNLLGLTPEQVIARLGPATYDPRIPHYGSTRPDWISDADGNLYLAYYQNWNTCVISFINGRVTRVDKHWK